MRIVQVAGGMAVGQRVGGMEQGKIIAADSKLHRADWAVCGTAGWAACATRTGQAALRGRRQLRAPLRAPVSYRRQNIGDDFGFRLGAYISFAMEADADVA